jgi:pantoate--beta-alanine ligase
LREEDGLAMSSRNMLLTSEERSIAKLVPKMMEEARDIAKQIGVSAAKSYIHNEIAKVSIMKLDYYEVCDTETLKPLTALKPNQKAISLIAVFVGNIRLIDNWMID